MGNFINSNTWIWNSEKNVQIKVSKLATSFGLKFELGNSSVEMTLDRADLQSLRDRINDVLIEGETNA